MKCGRFASFSTQKSFREALTLMAMEQKCKIVKILSKLNFSQFLERLGSVRATVWFTVYLLQIFPLA